jgi:sialidase-1
MKLSKRWLTVFLIFGFACALWQARRVTSAPAGPTEQGLTESDVFVCGREGYNTFRIPAIIATTKGALLAFCEGRKNSGSDTGEIDMLVKRSIDSGRTWGEQQVVWHDDSNTCGNACPVVDQTTGTVWLLLTHNLGQDTEEAIGQRRSTGTRTLWVCKSKDEGATWSKPVEITRTTKNPAWGWYATGPGVGIQLQHGPHAGRLLIPCNHSVQTNPHRPELFEYGDNVIYSDDHGRTWKLGGEVPAVGVDEPQVVELEDGSLMMNMRPSYGNLRVVSFSKDGGETWGQVWHDRALPDPPCQASLIRYTRRPGSTRNRLLFSNPPSSKERVNLTVRLSYDEGETWAVSKRICNAGSGYSCLVALPDMTIGCLYERGRDKDPKSSVGKITFARFSLDWLTDGADHL